MQIVLNTVEEPLENGFRSLISITGLFVALRDKTLLAKLIQLIVREQVRHHTRVQSVLDVFEEGLLNHVVIGEDERRFKEETAAECRQLVEFFEFGAEIFQVEVSTNFELVAVHLCNVGGKPS